MTDPVRLRRIPDHDHEHVRVQRLATANVGDDDSARRDSAQPLPGADARSRLRDPIVPLAALPTGTVHCVVTSPPQWQPAATDPQNGDQDQLGHGLAAYVDELRQVFTEVARVLNPTGTLWLHLADCAAENLPGIPWRVVFGLQADGWILRNTIVCCLPDPRVDLGNRRLASRHDLLFLLTRGPRYHLDIDPLRIPYTGQRPLSRRAHRGGTRPQSASTDRTPWPPDPTTAARGGNPGDVWTLPTSPDDSPADAFPLAIALRAISAGCPRRGLVLDPLAGPQTTGLAARSLDRRYIGISTLTTENWPPSDSQQPEQQEEPAKKDPVA